MTSLVPGYSQVSQFVEDAEYETNEDGTVHEEVSYVTLDLGAVEPRLVPSSSEYRLIGLDTPTPYVQLSGSIFKGSHETLLGTEILFTEQKDDHTAKKSLAYLTTTEQRVRFKEVELKPKHPERPQPSQNDDTRVSVNVLDSIPPVFAATASPRTGGRRGRPRGRGRANGRSKGKERASEEDFEGALEGVLGQAGASTSTLLTMDDLAMDSEVPEVQESTSQTSQVATSVWGHQVPQNEDQDMNIDPALR
ncbi:unnamed protein product [Somion occarium]|uniref:Transcription factor TFIIIC triple barrel domain-containing protein n=1 Tax=Somion occarium TaxID=3059160 RepID=A0ABP1D8F1_9APHY